LVSQSSFCCAMPELKLLEHSLEWTTLPDGHEGILVDGGGFDGENGMMFANAGDDLHAVGTLAPLAEGRIGCIVIKPNRFSIRSRARGGRRRSGSSFGSSLLLHIREVGVQTVDRLAELEVTSLIGELEHVGGELGQPLRLELLRDRYRDHRCHRDFRFCGLGRRLVLGPARGGQR
jgi:hypothetical protein